ncbi:unnamed protein product [Polarella glacialis]|uniref:Uncharacterized protein n=1 Tax=Polarella glacialis TaxID=89957 RepID=A0A813LK45_POLGL|nr:unnamed protein product [Polarella glacialis]
MAWPPQFQTLPPFAAFDPASSQTPVSQRAKVVRPGRLGKRERAEMKATRSKRGEGSSARQVKDSSSGSEDSGWQMAGGPAEAREAEVEGQQVGPNMCDLAAFKQLVNAEMENSRKGMQDFMAKMDDMMTTCKEHVAVMADAVNSRMNLTLEAAATEMKGKEEQTLSQFDEKLEFAMAEMQSKLEQRIRELEEKAAAATVEAKTELEQKLHSIDRSADAADATVKAMAQDFKDAIAAVEQKLQQLSSVTQTMHAEVKEEVKEIQASAKNTEEQLAETTIQLEALSAAAVAVEVVQAGEAAVEEVAEEAKSESGATDASSLNPQEPVQPPHPQALFSAIVDKKEGEALELLKLQQVPGLNNLDDYGESLLHDAIYRGLPAVALELLRRPDFALVNAIDKYGLTCLHWAYEGGHLHVCKAILARGDFSKAQARSTSTSFGGMHVPAGITARDIARQKGYQNIVELLQPHCR